MSIKEFASYIRKELEGEGVDIDSYIEENGGVEKFAERIAKRLEGKI